MAVYVIIASCLRIVRIRMNLAAKACCNKLEPEEGVRILRSSATQVLQASLLGQGEVPIKQLGMHSHKYLDSAGVLMQA